MVSLPSPQKLVAAAVNFLPTACRLSPVRLFAPPADTTPSVITEPPLSSKVDTAHLGRGLARARRQRVLVRNGSYHRSHSLKPIIDRRQRNSRLKKQAINARPSLTQPLATSPGPVPFGILQRQVQESVGHAPASSEDKIFLEQLAKLGAHPNNLDRFEIMEENAKCLEEERARAERVIRESPEDRALARRKRARLLRERRAEQARKAAERAERVRRVAAQLDQRVAEDKAREGKKLNEEQEARNERERRREEERQKRVEEVRKCRERAERELMLQRLRAGQPLTPKQLENNRLAKEVMAEFQEGERIKAETRQAARLEEEQRRLAQQERARLERERQLREEEAARNLATQRQTEEGERQRQIPEQQDEMRRALEAAQRRAEEMERERVAFWERENARRAAEQAENARRRQQEEEARRQAEFAQRQRLAQEEARQRAQEQARRQAAQEQAQRAAQGARASHVQGQSNPFQEYEAKWQALKGTNVHSDISFSAFPWPVLAVVHHPNQLRSWDVDMFLTQRGTAGKTLKAIVKAEILRWHPDKLAGPLKKVHPDHRDAVREGGEIIAKILNNFMENVTQSG